MREPPIRWGSTPRAPVEEPEQAPPLREPTPRKGPLRDPPLREPVRRDPPPDREPETPPPVIKDPPAPGKSPGGKVRF